ncbi:hypothetical protein D3C81_1344160 [compost metagenome]
MHKYNIIGQPPYFFDDVGTDKHGCVSLIHIFTQRLYQDLPGKGIEPGGRFIQQQQLGPGCQRSGNLELAALALRHFAQPCPLRHLEFAQQFLEILLVPCRIPLTAKLSRFFSSPIFLFGLRVLGHIGNSLTELKRQPSHVRFFEPADLTLLRKAKLQQHMQQCTFAGAILAHQCGNIALREIQIKRAYNPVAPLLANIPQFYGLLFHELTPPFIHVCYICFSQCS